MNTKLQQLLIYTAIGLMLSTAGVTWDTISFWAVLLLTVISNVAVNQAALELGLASGMELMVDMTDTQRAEVIALIKQAQQEENNE